MTDDGRLPVVAQRGLRPFAVYAGVVAGALAVFALDVSASANALSFAMVVAATVGALLLGPRLHRLPSVVPWQLLAAGCVAFGAGALLRPVAVGADGVGQAVADLFTLPGYVLVALGILALLRVRRAEVDVHAVADGLVVATGAGMLAVVVFAVPTLALPGRPLWLTFVASTYPVLDALLLLLIVQLAFTGRARTPAFALLATSMVALLAGDVGYAWIGTQGQLVGPHALDLFFVVSYACLGLGALHPSVRAFVAAEPTVVQAWSWRRLTLLGPALAAPTVISLTTDGPGTHATLAIGTALLMALLVTRSVTAVRDYARSQQGFRFQATHDPLTGLPNRLLLMERLDDDLAAQRSGSRGETHLLFIGVDGFKMVNDSWGHDVGDELLLAVSQRLVALAPESAVVARVGGDEFVMAFGSGPGGASGEEVAATALEQLRLPCALSRVELVVTGSIGIAVSDAGSDPESLVRDADTALYEAKSAGRARCMVFDRSMRDAVQARLSMEMALRQALAGHQLSVHYQPLVRISDGTVTGTEALLRWNHPSWGAVSPYDFISVAEETGLIAEIGAWVLGEALRQVGAWQDAGGGDALTMSVNVSGGQLLDPAFAGGVLRAVAREGLTPSTLCIEITESAALEQDGTVAANLAELSARGVRLAIDDFGTGYSSLSYLQRLPVQVIKIDRSFVTGLGGGEGDAEIVRASVSMAKSLGLTVVAEGVETEAQRDQLRLLGVDLAQGWFYGRAEPPELACWRGRLPAQGRPGTPELPEVAALGSRRSITDGGRTGSYTQ